jgi:uncharacterized protein YfkK (UPF0435 family)
VPYVRGAAEKVFDDGGEVDIWNVTLLAELPVKKENKNNLKYVHSLVSNRQNSLML